MLSTLLYLAAGAFVGFLIGRTCVLPDANRLGIIFATAALFALWRAYRLWMREAELRQDIELLREAARRLSDDRLG